MILSSRYKDGWAETQERFERWWKFQPMDRPLIRVTAPRDSPLGNTPRPDVPLPPRNWTDADYLIRRHRHSFENTYFAGESFPLVSADLGPGSLALYLGSEPVFTPHTVWFEPCIPSMQATPLPEFNPRNKWLRAHLELVGKLRDAFGDDAYVGIPDLVESLDVLAALRGPTQLLYDLMDAPADCRRWLKCVNDLYAPHYDLFYDRLKDAAGGSVFAAFRIWGPGKVAKVQCDFCAMLSPAQFSEFYIPCVREQLNGLDRSLYHLDGPNAVDKLDQLLTLEKLNAIQWIAGDGHAPHHDARWFPLYEKILKAGKGIQISLAADKIPGFVRRFGARGLFILTSTATQREADELLALAKRSA